MGRPKNLRIKAKVFRRIRRLMPREWEAVTAFQLPGKEVGLNFYFSGHWYQLNLTRWNVVRRMEIICRHWSHFFRQWLQLGAEHFIGEKLKERSVAQLILTPFGPASQERENKKAAEASVQRHEEQDTKTRNLKAKELEYRRRRLFDWSLNGIDVSYWQPASSWTEYL